jgi:hypothetical protein
VFGIAELRRAFFEKSLESGELFRVEFRPATRSRLGHKGLPNDFPPPPSRRKAAIQNIGGLLIAVTLLDQLAALDTQDLKFR